MLQNDSVIRAAPEEQVVACDLAGEAALLNLRTGSYFGLDRVGAAVWGLIQHETSLPQILRALLARYDVEPERCERDLRELIGQMAEAGLIAVTSASPTGATQVPIEPSRADAST